MTDNESMSKDRGEYGGDATLVSRAVTTERSPVRSTEGGYDPGFLTGGDGYRRTGKDRDGYGGDARADELGGYDREISRGKYRGGYDPGFLG